MKLSDLIELFVEPEDNAPGPGEVKAARERRDTSSLADIARILRELDGRYEPDHKKR